MNALIEIHNIFVDAIESIANHTEIQEPEVNE